MSSESLVNSKGTKATLLLCSVDSTAIGAVIMPILAVLAATFPDDGFKINLLVSIPPLVIIPTTLIAGRLSYYISRKTLLTVGQILYIIGGVGAAWFENIDYILVMRVILGIGCGIVYPIVPTLIAQFFSGHERAKMMGWGNAVGGMIAMLMSLAAGVLGTIGWHWPFYLDLFFVIVLIMQLRFLPKLPPERDVPELQVARENGASRSVVGRIDPRAWLCIALMLFSHTFAMVYLLKVAMFIAENGIGDSATAGLASSVTTGAAFLFAFTFPYAYRRIKRYTVVLPLIAATAAFSCMYLASTLPLVLIGCALFGCYLGYIIPYLQTTISAIVHPARRTVVLAGLSSAMFAGQALATPYVALIESFLGPTTRSILGVPALCFAGLLVLTTAYLVTTVRKAATPYPYLENLDAAEVIHPSEWPR